MQLLSNYHTIVRYIYIYIYMNWVQVTPSVTLSNVTPLNIYIHTHKKIY